MAGKRKSHSAAFKAQVALAAAKGDRTANELAAHFGVHPTLVHGWKKRLLGGAEAVFAGAKASAPTDDRTAELYEQIGRLKVEPDGAKKKPPRSADALRPPIDPDHPTPSVRRQCQLVGLTRSSYYLPPTEESADNLAPMASIDRQYTACPFCGSRRIAAWPKSRGHEVNRRRARRLLRLMGLEALYPEPNLPRAGRDHRVYPYLLRGVPITRVDRVWSAGITYVPLPSGFVSLAATSDWFSRAVVAWRPSNTPDGAFCRDMLDEALATGTPEVFDTDRGVQFTAAGWTSRIESAGARVSVDGRGRCLDDVFVERLWRSVKYEDVYLRGYESVPELERGLRAYFRSDSDGRLHQSLGYRTPARVYREGRWQAEEEPAKE